MHLCQTVGVWPKGGTNLQHSLNCCKHELSTFWGFQSLTHVLNHTKQHTMSSISLTCYWHFLLMKSCSTEKLLLLFNYVSLSKTDVVMSLKLIFQQYQVQEPCCRRETARCQCEFRCICEQHDIGFRDVKLHYLLNREPAYLFLHIYLLHTYNRHCVLSDV